MLGFVTNLDKLDATFGHSLITFKENFVVLDAEKKPTYIIDGFSNGAVMQSKEREIYIIGDTSLYFLVRNMMDGTEFKYEKYQSPGCYVFSYTQMMQGWKEFYKLSSAAVGHNAELVYSNFTDRIVYLKNYSQANICPTVHRNLLNLNGIQEKVSYLIWREKGGFFSAMTKTGEIQTWSLATGSKLYNLKHPSFGTQFADYEVYYTDDKDDSYHKGYHNFNHCSYSLIVSHEPLCELKRRGDCHLYQTVAAGKHTISTQLNHDVRLISYPDSDKTVKIERAERPRGVYKFFLLEMFGHLDCSEHATNQGFNQQMEEIKALNKDEEVRVALEFNFELGECPENQQFNWHETEDPTNHIYISACKTKLLEVVNRSYAIIYKVDDDRSEQMLDSKGNFSHNRVHWKKLHFINRFPRALQGNTSMNFLFSANFSYYLDLDFTNNNLIIMETATESPYVTIPSDMINFND